LGRTAFRVGRTIGSSNVVGTVVWVLVCPIDIPPPSGPVVHDIDGEALRLEPYAQARGEARLVFDHQ
jgi:hypothetical protein